MEKKKLILDITPLKNGYFQDGGRSGIFFTVKNILRELLLRDDITLYFNITREQADDSFKTIFVLKQEFPQYVDFILSRTFCNSGIFSRFFDFIFTITENHKGTLPVRIIRKAARILSPLSHSSRLNIPENIAKETVFLSLMYLIPEYIKEIIGRSKCCTMLYDTIPSVFPEYIHHAPQWYTKLIKGLSAQENYLTISYSSGNDFKRLFPEISQNDIQVVYLAASEHFCRVTDKSLLENIRKKYGIPIGKKIFFSHCSLAKHKNLNRLFTAFCKVRRDLPDWVMVFSGSNVSGTMEPMLDYARRENIPEEAFCFTGYVDDTDLPALYSTADLFCFVSLYEGFGLPVLEAMSCGTPCLVSNVSSIPEVAAEAAIYADPLDADDIARKMLHAAQHAEEREIFSLKGLDRAKKFSWNICCGEILEKIKNIC